MAPAVHCRDFRAADWPAVRDLWEATGLGGAQRGDNAAMIATTLARGGRFLVLEERAGGGLAGTAWLTNDGRRLHLHHFGISPARQGQGLGRLLLEEVLAAARDTGLQLKLEVHRDNARAQDLYRRNGFAGIGDYEILMVRDLSSFRRRA